MPQKAISLTQPWASMVILREKGFETRGRKFNHRGPTWIHATKTMPEYAVRLFEEDPFFLAFRERHQIKSKADLPFGAVLGRVEVLSCYPSAEVKFRISESERAFGNYDDGRYAIRIGSSRELAEPVECGGQQAMPWTMPEMSSLLWPIFKDLAGGVTQAIKRVGFPKEDTSRYRDIDWPEHATHENGAYVNFCLDCGVDFLGHKRCNVCRRCWIFRGTPPPTVSPC